MGDPLSIAVTAFSLIDLCVSKSSYIYSFISSARAVDDTIGLLDTELTSLSLTLNSVHDSFIDPSLRVDADGRFASQKPVWTNVERCLKDCEKCLRQLEDIIRGVAKRKGYFRRVRAQIRLNMKSDDIDLLRKQIAGYRGAMELSLQLVTMHVSLIAYFLTWLAARSKILKPGTQLLSLN